MSVDLRDLMDERSQLSADPPSGPAVNVNDLLAGVHTRIDRHLRRRTVAVGVAVAVAVALLATLIAVPGLRDRMPEPAATPTPTVTAYDDGFPEYFEGTRKLASATGQMSAGALSLRFTPQETRDLVFRTWCQHATNVAVTVDGRDFFSGGCGPDMSLFYPTGPPEEGAGVGLTAGTPATITVTVIDSGAPIDPGARFGLSVSKRIPFADYPLPIRPGALAPIIFDLDASSRPQLDLRSVPGDPLRAVSASTVWRDGWGLWLDSQTPGSLVVTVNGRAVLTNEWWVYNGGSQLTYFYLDDDKWLDLKDGDPITVTVTPQDVTGDWAVVVLTAE